MDNTETDVPIPYKEHPVSATITDCYLYPLKGKHQAKDIQRAKFWLKGIKGKKFRYIMVEWRIRDDEEPLEKIPDIAMISHLKLELGKSESYVTELEEKLATKDEIKPSSEQIKEIYKDKLYVQQKKEISKLHKAVKVLRKQNRQLVQRIIEINADLPKGISEHDFGDTQSDEE